MVLGKLPVPGRPTIWIIVEQGPIALAAGAGGGGLDIFTLLFPVSPLSPSEPRDFFPPCRGPGAQFPLGTSLN